MPEVQVAHIYGIYEIFGRVNFRIVAYQRAFGPDASEPRDFWSGCVRTKTSGPNTESRVRWDQKGLWSQSATIKFFDFLPETRH